MFNNIKSLESELSQLSQSSSEYDFRLLFLYFPDNGSVVQDKKISTSGFKCKR